MNLKTADVERSAVPVKGTLRIQLEDSLGETVVPRALIDASGNVAQRFAGFDEGQCSAISVEPFAKPAQVAQPIAASLDSSQQIAAVNAFIVSDRSHLGRRRSEGQPDEHQRQAKNSQQSN